MTDCVHKYDFNIIVFASLVIRITWQIMSRRWRYHVWEQEKFIQRFDGRWLERFRRWCEDDIKTDLKVTGWDGVDWSNSSQYRGCWRGTVNDSGHSASIKCGQFHD